MDDFRFQWVPFSSDPGIGNIEVLQKGQHQDVVAHDVTVAPLIRQACVFLQRVPRVMSTGELFWATKLEVCQPCNLAAWSAWSCCSPAGSFTPTQGRVPAPCRAAMLPRASTATIPRARLHSSRPSTSPCWRTSILGHWRDPFLFNKGHVPMFSTLLLLCALGETATPPHAPHSIRSSQSSFSRRLCFWPAVR